MLDMDRKRKMLATASFQAQGACTEFTVDRFSDLPVEVAHHILSFLTFRDIRQVGCVSKRCLELYLSYPSVYFGPGFPYKLGMWQRLMAFNYFDRFLTNRGDNRIQWFRIRWSYHPVKAASKFDELFRICTWIRKAVRCNVEVLDLQLDTRKGTPLLALPSCIFACQSLRSLLVDFYGDILKWPSSACFPNLQHLKLTNVKIVGEELFCKWISSSKFLRKLELDNIDGIKHMTVESSSLESFSFRLMDSFSFMHPYHSILCHLSISGQRLEDIHVTWEFGPPSTMSLNIFAPSLKYLKWGGNLMDHQNLGNLMQLEKAEINLYPKVDDSDKVFEILCRIGRVKVLFLNENTMKTLLTLNRKGSMPALGHISYLGLRTCNLSGDLVPEIVSLLKGMTALRKLCITSDPPSITWRLDPNDSSSWYNMSYRESDHSACMHHLQEVMIEISNCTDEWELAKYILKHAENLKKMVILYSPWRPDVPMLRIPEMISAATVVFQKK